MMDLDASDRSCLIRIRDALSDATAVQKAVICAMCLEYRLMLPKGIYMWLLWRSAKVLHGKNVVSAFATAMAIEKHKPLLDEMWDQTILWLVDGKDATDPKSAGGWNQNELTMFVIACNSVGALRPIV